MTRARIGGKLDLQALGMLASTHEVRANRHRPTDPAAIAAEARRLAATGLTAGDIAAALRLAPDAVRTMLREVAG